MKKTNSPFDAITESLAVILDADYEDTDVTDEELALAKKRFAHALRYVIISTIEEDKKCVASNKLSE